MDTTDIFELLSRNDYPGRGVVAGCMPDGRLLTAYFIMGRSANSRNRIFTANGDALCIQQYDIQEAFDPALVLYTPIRTINGRVIVTNGDHTDTIYAALQSGGDAFSALQTRTFEPDAPHFTPRISCVAEIETQSYMLSILKSADAAGTAAERQFFCYAPRRGVGHLIHTYQHGGAPLPAFSGEPACVALPDLSVGAMTERLWESLSRENRVSLAVRCTDVRGEWEQRIINRNGEKA